jgi:hypothetical protein
VKKNALRVSSVRTLQVLIESWITMNLNVKGNGENINAYYGVRYRWESKVVFDFRVFWRRGGGYDILYSFSHNIIVEGFVETTFRSMWMKTREGWLHVNIMGESLHCARSLFFCCFKCLFWKTFLKQRKYKYYILFLIRLLWKVLSRQHSRVWKSVRVKKREEWRNVLRCEYYGWKFALCAFSLFRCFILFFWKKEKEKYKYYILFL